MEKTRNIDFAILETIRVHPDYKPSLNAMISENIFSSRGINLRNFTSTNGARKGMQTVTQRDLLQFILEESIKCYNAIAYYYYNNPEVVNLNTTEEKMAQLLNKFPYYGVIAQTVELIAHPKINSIIYFTKEKNDLMALIDAIVECRYKSGEEIRTFIDNTGTGKTVLPTYGVVDLFAKVNEDVKKSEVATKVSFNPAAENKCLLDILSGSQLKHQHNEYGLDGTLFASQDIGKRRSNQEDAVLIMTHPNNPNFKIVAVADGMGGVEHGDKGSSYTVKELSKWFQALPADLYYYPSEVQQLLNKRIAQISNNIYEEYNKDYNKIRCGSTLVASIITSEYTIMSSVGDSRIYSVRDNNLELLTRDESAVWPPYKNPSEVTTTELDDIRFFRNNNYITRCIGEQMSSTNIQTGIIPNTSYDQLLLLTDGITDLLTQEEIKVISATYPIEKITGELVRAAMEKNAYRPEGEDELHHGVIPAGKDNATAAMYRRR